MNRIARLRAYDYKESNTFVFIQYIVNCDYSIIVYNFHMCDISCFIQKSYQFLTPKKTKHAVFIITFNELISKHYSIIKNEVT